MERPFLAAAALLVAACAHAQTPAAARDDARQPPTLLVVITVDQLRGDYLDRWKGQLDGGLARLARGGAWYANAHHDHGITETAPGHASVLSGRFPRSTGITANRVGVLDPEHPLIGSTAGTGASPLRFRGTTLVDWMLAADSTTRVLSVSMKDRGAILPVGRSRQEVYWYPGDGSFTTSTYYGDSLPSWVTRFNARRLPHAYAGRRWELSRDSSFYPEPDDVSVEAAGVGRTFPHIMPADSAAAASVVRGTPWMDDLTLAFALDGVTAMQLGGGARTDVLAISLSASDLIGHRFGPDSRELHDQILRLDRALGTFLDSLFRLRDSSRVLIALTADHGVGIIPELAAAGGHPTATRVRLTREFAAFRAALAAKGVDTTAFELDGQLLFVDRAALRGTKVSIDSAIAAFRDVALKVPGVARVDRYRRLLADTARDPIARRWAHQLGAGEELELVMTLTPHSLWNGIPASHGSPYDYDSHVPIIFSGPGVNPGRHDRFVRTVDIAPTLAALLGVAPQEKLDGVVLKDAIR